jgi:spore maturation protein CgeB
MRFVFYTHSVVSDWNHGNAHFLRGVLRELVARGHTAVALEPEDGWSRQNLLAEAGPAALDAFAATFPELKSVAYGPDFDHEAALADADVVVVHEWTDPALVARVGRARRDGGRFTLFFHDTHHRGVSGADEIAGLEIEGYDAVLAFGEALRELYLGRGWSRAVFTWHEAADVRLFRPPAEPQPDSTGLVWIGNWGDGERTAELRTYLLEPVRQLGLPATVHGVRYPPEAIAALGQAGIAYRGWVPNHRAPEVFAAHRMTVHVPRRPYVEALPGIPTIRVFEALACGIPLVSAPWRDAEGLFREGDFLWAHSGDEMRRALSRLDADAALRSDLMVRGLETIRARHTCAHRVDELFAILADCGTDRVRRGLSEILPDTSPVSVPAEAAQ